MLQYTVCGHMETLGQRGKGLLVCLYVIQTPRELDPYVYSIPLVPVQ